MKKMIFLLVVLILLSGCQRTVEPEKDGESDQVDIIKIEDGATKTGDDAGKTPVIRDEKAVLEAFDALAIDSVKPSELNTFLMNHISNLSIDSANYAFVTYMNQVLDYTGRVDGELLSPAYQKLAEEAFEGVFMMEALDKISDQGFVDTVKKLYANGMTIAKEDGYYVAVIDFDRLQKSYGNEIGEDIKAFIGLVQMTLKEEIGVADRDAMNRVATLIVEHDKYLKTYPNSIVIDEVREKRDWLRTVYFLESTCKAEKLKADTEYVLDSFKDVIQFYPGTDLEKMTQDFITVWTQSGKTFSPVLEAFVEYYDSGIKNTEFGLLEGETPEGQKYPKAVGIESTGLIETRVINMLSDLTRRYAVGGQSEWAVSSNYKIEYLDQDEITVVFHMDLENRKFPKLSIRDMSGHTFSLESGKMMTLEEILPTEEESFIHLLADIKQYANKNHFDPSGIDAEWTGVFKTSDGIVLYKGGVYTGHNADEILIPNDQINQWIH